MDYEIMKIDQRIELILQKKKNLDVCRYGMAYLGIYILKLLHD